MSSTKIKVRYAETDVMAIVHHANYFLAKGSTLQTFVDSKTFKIINLKKERKEVWINFIGE